MMNYRLLWMFTPIAATAFLSATANGTVINLSPPPAGDSAITAPVDGAQNAGLNRAADSVFQWTEVPQNQDVPIVRAVFDANGYQLFDTKAETIVVPFAESNGVKNPYVMEFARSRDSVMHFVNTGKIGVLYVPIGGCLENATVPGALWYPFTSSYDPVDPAPEAIAPSYDDLIDMCWYPNMEYHGGYYSSVAPHQPSRVRLPIPRTEVVVGRWRFSSNAAYVAYCEDHTPPYRLGSLQQKTGVSAVQPQPAKSRVAQQQRRAPTSAPTIDSSVHYSAVRRDIILEPARSTADVTATRADAHSPASVSIHEGAVSVAGNQASPSGDGPVRAVHPIDLADLAEPDKTVAGVQTPSPRFTTETSRQTALVTAADVDRHPIPEPARVDTKTDPPAATVVSSTKSSSTAVDTDVKKRK